MGDRAMSLRVHIDELVLHGFAPGDRMRIADAVQLELTRLFTDRGVPPALRGGGAVERLNAGAFPTAGAAPAERTGARIAQTVYEGLATWRAE